MGGLGLGLAITKAIVDLHAGVITTASAGLGKGATFTMEFRTATTNDETLVRKGIDVGTSHAQTRATARAKPSDGLRILLVDDHVDTLRSMERLLRLRGHRVVTAASVSAALAMGAENSFDLLISDVGLPDGSGMDLMRELRQQHGETLRGIALSGYGMEEDVARSHAAGFSEHLTKPVDMNTLAAVISKLLGC